MAQIETPSAGETNTSNWVIAILTSGTIGAIALKVVDAWLKKKADSDKAVRDEVTALRAEVARERTTNFEYGIKIARLEAELQDFIEMKASWSSMRQEIDKLSRMLLIAGIDPLTGDRLNANNPG